MKVEVLVTTMHASDCSKYREMKLNTDAVIANQSNEAKYEEWNVDGHSVKMVSTTTKGLSRNRNIALAHSNQESEILVFADDDLVFVDEYEKTIIHEFVTHPEADAIKFNLVDLSKVRKISMKRIERFEKATRKNMSSSGVCGLAIKASVLKKSHITFHENFGSGTENYCGEDTIFLQQLISEGVRMYRSPIDIAGIDQSESSWFKGYDSKYFTTVGKVLAVTYPKICKLLAIRSSYRFSKNSKCSMKFGNILACYLKGIREIKEKN